MTGMFWDFWGVFSPLSGDSSLPGFLHFAKSQGDTKSGLFHISGSQESSRNLPQETTNSLPDQLQENSKIQKEFSNGLKIR